MTLADDIRATAAEAEVLVLQLAAAQTALLDAIKGRLADAATIIALEARVTDLTKRLADCEGGPPPPPPPVDQGYVFGVNRSPDDFGKYTAALLPAEIGIERQYVTAYEPPFQYVSAATAAGHQVAFSVKPGTYAEVSSGSKDAYLMRVGNALRDVEGFGDVWHEWENDPQLGTPAQGEAAWEHAASILRPLTPKMSWGKILMAWAFNPRSGIVATDWIPSSADFIGADGYWWATGGYVDPGPLFARVANLADTLGKGWGVFECNAPINAPRKAEWIRGAAGIARDRGALCLIAFDKLHSNGDWRSSNDPAAMVAWREAATNRVWSA